MFMSGLEWVTLLGACFAFWFSGYLAGRARMARRWRADRERYAAAVRTEVEAWHEAEWQRRLEAGPGGVS